MLWRIPGRQGRMTPPGTSGVVRYDAAQSLTAAQQSQARANVGIIGRNHVINGRFEVDQINVGVEPTVTADAAFGPDMWKLLGEDSLGKFQGRDTTTAGIDGATAGFRFNGKVTCVTANNKYGAVHYIRGRDCKHLRGQQVVLSFNLHVSNARLGNMKAGIVEWTSTEDAPTADMISSWGADGVTPTLASNFAFKNTPANLSATTTPAVYSVTATLGNTFNNLAVFIWNDDKAFTANDAFYVTDVQLEPGSVASSYDVKDYDYTWRRCRQYVWKSFPDLTAPAQNVGSYNGAVNWYGVNASTRFGRDVFFDPEMFATPTITFYNPAASNAQARDVNASADCTSTQVGNTGSRSVSINATQPGGGIQGGFIGVHLLAVARLG